MPRGSRLLSRVRDEIDDRTSLWSKYTSPKFFTDFTHPRDTFRDYVSEQFAPAQRLWRSASATSLSFDTNMRENFGSLRRSDSYTSLSPSYGMELSDRRPPRYVNQYRVYTTKSDNWQRENSQAIRDKSFARQMKERKDRAQRRLPIPFHTPPTYKTAPSYPDYQSWLPKRTPPAMITRPVSLTRYEYDDFRFRRSFAACQFIQFCVFMKYVYTCKQLQTN